MHRHVAPSFLIAGLNFCKWIQRIKLYITLSMQNDDKRYEVWHLGSDRCMVTVKPIDLWASGLEG